MGVFCYISGIQMSYFKVVVNGNSNQVLTEREKLILQTQYCIFQQ